MSKIAKLILKLQPKPIDFTWDELIKVLAHFEFEVYSGGKTGGSRRKFVRQKDKAIISLHEPHPQKVLKPYMVKEVLKILEKHKLL
ncbi:type II toxin-antitoxin system HicA family toxin [Reichenbachiella sp.]|uniref:type II toxin-antitoxin system HicA family toxin n=1 Tax=Reichenbachiella sp. TaxID=2184521 RepID=UPI003B5C7EF4